MTTFIVHDRGSGKSIGLLPNELKQASVIGQLGVLQHRPVILGFVINGRNDAIIMPSIDILQIHQVFAFVSHVHGAADSRQPTGDVNLLFSPLCTSNHLQLMRNNDK